ncbi:MAG: hypothetical protein H0T84_11395 [Tatlockia sp.]|nr:hypothetical protein [Tatlockia sp.]
MKNKLYAIWVLGLIPAVSIAYIPFDIEKLKKSDNCQKCDITEYTINTGEKESFSAVKLNNSY